MIYTRIKTREKLMIIFYQMSVRKDFVVDIEEILTQIEKDRDRQYFKEVLDLFHQHVQEIDEILNGAMQNYSTKLINKVELAILRISTIELIYMKDIPVEVSINEAVELAKLYSLDKAPAFINGVLGRVADEKR